MHIEVGNNHCRIVHLLALMLALIPDLLCDELAARARLLEPVLADNLTDVVRLEMVPDTVRGDCKEAIARDQLMEDYLWLARDSDLMSYQVTQ